MNCEQISEHLADYVGRELDPQGRLAFESHLEHCATCSAEVLSLRETVVALERVEAPPAPAVHPASLRIGRLQPFAYAAVLLMGLGIGWWIKPADPAGPSPIERPPAVKVQDTPAETNDAWVNAAAKGRTSTPFARNTVRLVRALSGG